MTPTSPSLQPQKRAKISEYAEKKIFNAESTENASDDDDDFGINMEHAVNFKGNHFNELETQALYLSHFSPNSNKEQVSNDSGTFEVETLSQDSIKKLFSYFEAHPELEKQFFAAFTNKERVTFKKYLRFLSIVVRGTPKERAFLTMKVLGIHPGDVVQKSDFISMITKLIECIQQVDPEFKRHVDPNFVADSIFSYQPRIPENPDQDLDLVGQMDKFSSLTDTLLEEHASEESKEFQDAKKQLQELAKEMEDVLPRATDSLKYETFESHAKNSSSFSNCFGLFSLIHRRVSKGILQQSKAASTRMTRQEPSMLDMEMRLGSFVSTSTAPQPKKRKRDEKMKFRGMTSPKVEQGKRTSSVLPHYTGNLYTKKWDDRNDAHMLVEIRNGFMLFFEANAQGDALPFHFAVLHEASAQIMSGKEYTDSEFLFTYKTSQSVLSRVFKADSRETRDEWIQAISESAEANLPEPNQYDSFAAVHENVSAQYFICGRDYFDDLADNLLAAKKSIFMTGWHFTPDLYLKRGADKEKYRVDAILKERASQGVKIFILVWCGSALMSTGANRAREMFPHNEFPNIHVINDPEYLKWYESKVFNFWTQHQKMVAIDGAIGYCGGIDVALNRFDTPEFKIVDQDAEMFPGLDYCNPMAGYTHYDKPIHFDEHQDRFTVPRMPWHDLQCKVLGAPVLDLQRNFIQRWEASRQKNASTKDWIIIPDEKPQEPAIPQDNVKHHKTRIQILRSVSKWSFGFTQTEQSMYTAQLDAIRHSKHFIYIGNQFFTSTNDISQPNPTNTLVKELVNRVIRAHYDNEEFRLILLHPQQTSSNLDDYSRVPLKLVYWQYGGVLRAQWGLWQSLVNRIGEILGKEKTNKYLTIHSLRSHGKTTKVNGEGMTEENYLTEMAYIHAKMMIVDDEKVFVSSHNVNDRSFLGSRDSEIGMMIEDAEKVPVKINGVTTPCSKFVHEMRMDLFRMLLGFKDQSEDSKIADPFEAFKTWREMGRANSEIFDRVFDCVHAKTVDLKGLKTLSNYKTRPKNVNLQYVGDLDKVKGFIEDFPRPFLENSWEDIHTRFLLDGLKIFDAFFV
eukprot:CAMPEP_0117441610 /NCGR_PEP_ID=MMETSP0759-20121206/3723_1 /TAXON_ID=63605 /ORGANISM="Percolomonas cosmopolitus, Strain WS" /LENGTH=1075 /DNA_ID=CAMNT_0005233469 /DNA_START=8 /DNA_END=3235 /DNA_ORIENTATION=+